MLQTGIVPLESYTIINLTSGTISGSFDVIILPPGYSFGQTTTTVFVTKTSDILWKFRSKQTGDWNEVSTWESSVDGSSWFNATQTPTEFNADEITIRNTHTVTVSANTAANKVIAESGSMLNVMGTLTILK